MRLSSSRSLVIQMTFAVVEAIALYSASELDLDIVPYFLDFHEMGELPSMIR